MTCTYMIIHVFLKYFKHKVVIGAVTVLVYLHDHLDGGQRGGDVLRVRRPHRDWHTAGVKAAIKRHDEVDSWERT